MQFGSDRETVSLDYLHPTYSCDLSTDAGAYVVKEGAAYTLKWDTTSSDWEKATWISDVLTFSYWLEKNGKVGDQQLWKTVVAFNDPNTSRAWNGGAFSSNIDANRLFTFNVNPGSNPNTDDRSSLEDGIKTVFPYQMAFNFDELAANITGGAMLCSHYSVEGDVYAMQGRSQNLHAVGAYSLLSDKGEKIGKVATHSRKLVVGDKTVPVSGMSGNRLWWKGLSPEETKTSGLPASGFVEFSSGGHVIKHSSFGVRGIRQLAPTEALVSETSLQLQDLLSMNPYAFDDEGNVVDLIQQNAMEDFYKILQYYMPSDDLQNFIADNPPDIGEIRDIAEDDKMTNSQWYGSLSVPYLVQALAQGGTDNVAKLNARRAQAILKQATATSAVYKDQSAKLYSYEWEKKFPLMTQFLEDQRDNAASHKSAITDDAAQWEADISEGLEETTDPDEKEELDQMKKIPQDAATNGKEGKYWAYMFFRYLSSPNYLTMLRMQMMDGNTSQTITQDIQRYAAILSILDPTSYFAEQFVNVIGIYQLSSLLPSILDVSGNLEDYTFFMQTILEAFIDKYIDSEDPQMKDQATKIAEELRVNALQDYLNLFNASASVLSNETWTNLAEAFQSKAIAKFGAGASVVANGLALSAVCFSIAYLATGTISWDELTGVQQADFITSCVKVYVIFVRRSFSAAVALGAGAELKEAFKVLLFKDVSASQDACCSVFERWIARNSSYEKPSIVDQMLFNAIDHEAEFEVQYPRLVKMVGRNMEEFMATRFAAAMSIVSIVLSAISLANSSTKLETAMNSLFVASATLDLVAASASWALSLGFEGFAFATIASLASGLAVAAAIGGIVVMMVIMFTHKDPPSPVDTFVNSSKVKNAGLFMEYSTAVDYFQVISDESGKPRELGVSFQPEDSSYYLNSSSDGSVSLGALTHGYASVMSINTDDKGQATLMTKVWDENDETSALALTLDDNKSLKMSAKITDTDKTDQQKWVVTCTGGVHKDDEGHLLSATFTIYNAHWGTSYYLNSSGRELSVSSNQKKWILEMQPMKPEKLSFPDISLTTSDKDQGYYPYLLQVGSLSGRTWSVDPALPDFMQLDVDTGKISQKSAVVPSEYSQTTFTITVTNDYGSADTTFYIEVKKPEET